MRSSDVIGLVLFSCLATWGLTRHAYQADPVPEVPVEIRQTPAPVADDQVWCLEDIDQDQDEPQPVTPLASRP